MELKNYRNSRELKEKGKLNFTYNFKIYFINLRTIKINKRY